MFQEERIGDAFVASFSKSVVVEVKNTQNAQTNPCLPFQRLSFILYTLDFITFFIYILYFYTFFATIAKCCPGE